MPRTQTPIGEQGTMVVALTDEDLIGVSFIIDLEKDLSDGMPVMVGMSKTKEVIEGISTQPVRWPVVEEVHEVDV